MRKPKTQTKTEADKIMDYRIKKNANESQKKLEEHRAKVAVENTARINFAKETFFPLLKSFNKDIGFTKQMLQTLNVAIQQGFQNLILKMTVKELGIDKYINEDFNDREMFLKVLKTLEEHTIARAQNYLGDFTDVVEGYATKELDKRNINEVNLDAILNEISSNERVFLK